ncbi:MAG: hypothetical protein NTU63_00550, partial [Candidatus Pacearchaeota archaeon]|nr:hypothetical protein [Candidatus Pacearchaeota archaeon]
APTCTPTTCASLNHNCGNWTDGCSGTLSCGVFGNGSCQTGQTCNATGSCIQQIGYICGNNIIEPGEACDGSDLNGYNCSSVAAGFKSGTLRCNTNCKSYDVSQCVVGNTINALSCSQTDIQAAINNASNGYTVNVPAGNCVWTNPICISGSNYCTPVHIFKKSIVLKGAGIDKTNITSSFPVEWYNNVMVVENQGMQPTRVTGFTFTRSTSITIALSNVINFRVDHCKFNDNTQASIAVGSSRGVIDHCIVINSNIGIRNSGDNDASWNRPIIPGTSDAVFAEDNIFIADKSGTQDCGSLNEQIYHDSWGARSTVRNNLFDGSACNKDFAPFEAHGNWPNPPYTARGVVMIEAYNNIFKAYKTYRFMHFRGGSLLIFNNSMTYLSGGRPAAIALTDENDWQTAFFNPLDTTWSAQDQVFNSFFWDNTMNNLPVNESDVWLWNALDAPFIQKNRDYWMHAPNTTGGRTEWIDPSNPGADNNEILVSGANAYYPYTPYAYPHPLTLI